MSTVASLLVLGCGSSESNPTAGGSSGPLTKAQFVEAAERICEKGLKDKEKTLEAAYEKASARKYTEAELAKQREEAAENMLSSYQQIAAGLGELLPPPKDRATVKDILGKMQAAIAEGEANALSLVESNPFDEADIAAKAYGLETCGTI